MAQDATGTMINSGKTGAASIRTGYRPKLPRPGKVLFGKDVIDPLTVIGSLCNLAVKIVPAQPDNTGTIAPSGKLDLSNQNAILTLLLQPPTDDGGGGTANIAPYQVTAVPTGTNDFFAAKTYSFTGGASGSAVNVALPPELRNANNPGAGYAISQPYAVNDIVAVLSTSAGQNGVTVSSVELTLMDLGLGRTWSTGPGTIAAFTISTTVNSEYWVCTPVGGGSSTNVAKPGKLRNSVTSATIDGTGWTYSYTTTIERTAISGSYGEYQRLSPRVLAGDLIIAANIGAASTGVTSVDWQDLNVNAVAWAPKVDQSTP